MNISEELAGNLIGAAFPKYRVVEEIGAGSFGAVFKVASDYLERAVKIIPLAAGRKRESGSVTSASDLLARDWRHLLERYERLRCSEVVAVHDFHLVETTKGEKHAQAYGLVLMELYPGNLEDWVFDADPRIERRLEAIQAVAGVLDVLEQKQGFRFEDLKPSNVLVRDEVGGAPRVVVGDIGGLKSIGSVSRASTGAQFSLDYVAPEVVRGGRKVDTAAMIYGFGLLAFFVLEGGRLPYSDAGYDDRYGFIRNRGPDFDESTIPSFKPTRNVIARCLAFAPEDRFADFASVVEALGGGTSARLRGAAFEMPPQSSEPMKEAFQSGETIVVDELSSHRYAPHLMNKPAPRPIKTVPVPVDGGSLEPLSTFCDRLKNGGEGPEMVVVPSGEFWMGSPVDEPGRFTEEGPRHTVRIARLFALGKYAVTFEEFDQFLKATGYDLELDDWGWGRGRRPAIGVNWQHAQDYLAWLAAETGGEYRLPSEAEWEYGCRAGTERPFCTGRTITTQQANFNGGFTYNRSPQGENRQGTVLVGTFPANAWGLHEMHGNVFEWCDDCWNKNYEGAPPDGSAWRTGNCADRVFRGGSWGSRPGFVRSAFRNKNHTGYRFYNVGFRVARSLPPPK